MNATAPLGVVHFGLGPIGIEVLRLVQARPGVRSVGAVDIDPALLGRDLAELLEEGDPTGVSVSDAAAALASPGATVVAHCTGSSLAQVTPQLLECVQAGLPVVSTCEELAYPWDQAPDLSRQLDDAARARGVAVLGTGVNPGFVMDYFAVVLSAASRRVDHVAVHRVQEAGTRRLPLQRKVGAGMTVEEFEARVQAGGFGHRGLPESAQMVAAAMGWSLTEIVETLDPAIAERPTPSGLGEIAPGLVTGIHQVVRGSVDGREVVSLVLDMAVGLDEPRDEVRLTGDPDVSLVVPGGLHGDVATAAMVVNSLRLVADAPPGLRVMTDLAPPHPSAR